MSRLQTFQSPFFNLDTALWYLYQQLVQILNNKTSITYLLIQKDSERLQARLEIINGDDPVELLLHFQTCILLVHLNHC
jgi:hypothetical protein